MWAFCLACLFFMLLSPFSCFLFLSKHFVFLQHWCLSSMPVQQADQALWQALVCARPFPASSEWKFWLQISGLIHLFVVSGSHFIVLQRVLEKLRLPRFLQFFILWLYNAMTGFSAPGTRACMALSFSFLFKIRSEQKLFAVAIFCLALQPSWATSYSFWLSWLASLILIVIPPFKIDLLRNLIFYGVWLTLGFSISPWAIPMNLIVGPFISWVLFPLAFLSYIPGISGLFHYCVIFLQKILESISGKSEMLIFPTFITHLAGLVLLTHFILQIRLLQWQGKNLR